MFRPCIDLHQGRVKQIVGSTLTADPAALRTHFVSDHSAAWYAELYKRDGLRGGHIIMLGSEPANVAAAREALRAYPNGMQIGGGINLENAPGYLEAGASHVIVTSWIFPGGKLDLSRLESLAKKVTPRRLVLDLSCRKEGKNYRVMIDRWQTPTDVILSREALDGFAPCCDEFLVHAVDVEGLCAGVDLELVDRLGKWSSRPVTYAGGARSMSDLEEVTRAGAGRVDLTIGSALDIFGGTGVRYQDLVERNRRGDISGTG